MTLVTTMFTDVFESILLSVKTIYTMAAMYAHLQARRLLLLSPEINPAWHIHKAFVIHDTKGDYLEITHWFEPETWESDITEELPAWGTDWHLEVRYSLGPQRKFRSVVRPGQVFQWPPLSVEDAISHYHEIKGPQGILSAQLVPHGHLGDATPVDITRRVKKYAGPLGDFKGSCVGAQDIFPSDDNEWNAERFAYVRMICADFGKGISTRIVDFKSNAPLSRPETDDAKKM